MKDEEPLSYGNGGGAVPDRSSSTRTRCPHGPWVLHALEPETEGFAPTLFGFLWQLHAGWTGGGKRADP